MKLEESMEAVKLSSPIESTTAKVEVTKSVVEEKKIASPKKPADYPIVESDKYTSSAVKEESAISRKRLKRNLSSDVDENTSINKPSVPL